MSLYDIIIVYVPVKQLKGLYIITPGCEACKYYRYHHGHGDFLVLSFLGIERE